MNSDRWQALTEAGWTISEPVQSQGMISVTISRGDLCEIFAANATLGRDVVDRLLLERCEQFASKHVQPAVEEIEPESHAESPT